MKMEVGKEYKTYDGSKVSNVRVNDEFDSIGYQFLADIHDVGGEVLAGEDFTADGRYWVDGDRNDPWDIASEWNDHPYPIGKMIPWEAKRDSVCPVPDGTDVTMYFAMGESLKDSNPKRWSWNTSLANQIIGFVVHTYPEPEETYWGVVDNNSPQFAGKYTTKEDALESSFEPTHAIHYRITDDGLEIIEQVKL